MYFLVYWQNLIIKKEREREMRINLDPKSCSKINTDNVLSLVKIYELGFIII